MKQDKINKKIDKILRKGELKVSVKGNQLNSIATGAVTGALAFGAKGGILGGLAGATGNTFVITKLYLKPSHFEFKNKDIIIKYSSITDVVPEKNKAFTRKYGTFDGFVTVYLDNDTKLEISCKDYIPLSIILREKMNEYSNNKTSQEKSNVDDLLKYAELFEKGLITREEFEMKKNELL